MFKISHRMSKFATQHSMTSWDVHTSQFAGQFWLLHTHFLHCVMRPAVLFKSQDDCWLYFLSRGVNEGKCNPHIVQPLPGFVFVITILLSHSCLFSSSLGVPHHIYYVLEVTQYVEPLCRWQLYWWHVQCSSFKVF